MQKIGYFHTEGDI